jgi:hypothetical protein
MKRKMVVTIGILALVAALPAAALASVKSDGAGGFRHQAGIQNAVADCDGTGDAFGHGDGTCRVLAPEDGTGNAYGHGPGDGTGLANGQAAAHKVRAGNGYGPGDGNGNDGVGPQDGTGFGPGDGTGDCDGDQLRLGARNRAGS